ncbi:hypothetical protein C5748_21995 [Phyllobacterium phragmitis]|uniref:DUF2971 domain-containing protein n=1 Tax=Phyllobacterium phragmitis TaxID=2670329 RepID=A0A2S9ILK1_9HYPH|nr:DUF2971 domain-containing protein [Phyllobacterium phragmitis]PRD41362.1 hypothetical protein C5748_21995 [Phyllobacterium phragmitis]
MPIIKIALGTVRELALAKVKAYSTPMRLYRYRPLGDKTDREIDAILKKFIYCPKFSDMNDPMEGMHRESLNYIIKGRSRNEREDIQQAKNKLGIASLSEVYDHEPMWAHYASNFRGMCVAYTTSKLLKAFPSHFDFVRMSYNEDPPVLLADRKTIIDKAKLTLSSKSVRWMSEREWRLITPGYGAAHYDDIKCVFRIYLGSRVEAKIEKKVRQEMAALNIPVLKMRIDMYKIGFSRTGD